MIGGECPKLGPAVPYMVNLKSKPDKNEQAVLTDCIASTDTNSERYRHIKRQIGDTIQPRTELRTPVKPSRYSAVKHVRNSCSNEPINKRLPARWIRTIKSYGCCRKQTNESDDVGDLVHFCSVTANEPQCSPDQHFSNCWTAGPRPALRLTRDKSPNIKTSKPEMTGLLKKEFRAVC